MHRGLLKKMMENNSRSAVLFINNKNIMNHNEYFNSLLYTQWLQYYHE